MAYGARWVSAAILGLIAAAHPARAQGPEGDFVGAFARVFTGTEACVTLRDVAPGAEPAVSDPDACARRLAPCATFDIAATVVALDRGLVPDANVPFRRDAQAPGQPPQAVNLRDAFRRPEPWVYEEVARRIGQDAYGKALAALRYGNADVSAEPVERMWLGESAGGLALSAVEQVDFLARLKRGELTTSAESQARTVEVIPFDRTPDGLIAWKTGACGPAAGPAIAWTVGWVDRGPKSTIFAAVETAPGAPLPAETAGRMRRLLTELGLAPSRPE